MIPTPHPRTVVGLKVENFKRVQAVDITPDPDNPIVTISGANAQGKSSVLDALWSALQSADAARATKTSRHVRDGANKATVNVNLGDIIVTRTWTKAGTSKLEVTSAETGATYKSPQKLLDGLMGHLTFDPLAFTRMAARDQVTALLDLVDIGIDLDVLAAERKDIYDQRTDVGRQRKALGEIPTINESLPAEESSATDLIYQIQQAQQVEASNGEQTNKLTAMRTEADSLDQQIAELTRSRNLLSDAIASQEDVVNNLPVPADTQEITAQLNNLETINHAVRANNEARATAQQADDLDQTYKNLTDELSVLDQRKTDALAAADFPLDGLSFDDQGVTYQGVPLGQASAAEQLRVSCALAAAMNPNVRVMRVTDGSLLDSASRKLLADLAEEQGFQIWMELVDETGNVGIVIEDGQVKEAAK